MGGLALHQPELIGRNEDLNKLKQAFENATAGRGSTVFIAGEAGIGKTRLVSELMKEVETKNAQIITGRCLLESLEPLMPVKSALREAGLFHLISGDPPPLVVSAYMTNDAGLLLAKAEREQLGLDPDIFAGMLKGVGNFVKDSMHKIDNVDRTGGINILGYQEYKIIVEESAGIFLAAVTKGSLSEFLVGDMKNILAEVQMSHGHMLKEWDGDLDKVSGIKPIISRLISSGKYDGKFLVDDPRIRQENVFDNVLMGIQRLSADRSLLLFLDDLHWADPSTLGLLHYLARNTKNNPVLIVGDYRPEDIVQQSDGKAHQLETAMQNMTREDLLEKIELDRLDRKGTEDLVRTTLGTVNFENELYDRIFRETEGTPFFVLEVVKLLAEEGWIKQDKKGVWNATAGLEKMDIPSKVYDVIKRRLDRLMKEQKKILDCASVVGEEFQSDVVGKVVGLNKIQLLENLSDVEKTHRLIHSYQKKYKFDHAKIREVLYNGIMDELKQEYHKLVADTIAELHRDNPDEALNALAHHYYEAKDAKAAEYLIKSADAAMGAYANDEAIRYYNKALTVLEDDEKIKIVNERLGDIYSLTSDLDNALKCYYSLIEKETDGRKKADLHRKVADMYNKFGRFAESVVECDKAIATLGEDRCIQQARLLNVKAWAEMLTNKTDKCREDAQDALRIAEEANDLAEMARAYYNIGVTYEEKFDKEGLEKEIEMLSKSLELREKVGNLYEISETLLLLAVSHRNYGEIYSADEEQHIAESKKCLSRNLEIKRKIGDKTGLTKSMWCLAWHEKNLDESLKYFLEGIDIARSIGNHLLEAQTLLGLSNILEKKGEVIKALECIDESIRIAKDYLDELRLAGTLEERGAILARYGRHDEALEIFKECLLITTKDPTSNTHYNVIECMGHIYRHKKNFSSALDCYMQTREIAEKSDLIWLKLSSHMAFAELYLDEKTYGEALDEALKAIEVGEQLSHKDIYFKGRINIVLGKIYHAMKDWDSAIKSFESAQIALDNHSKRVAGGINYTLGNLYYELALLWKDMGDPDKLKEYREKALQCFGQLNNEFWIEKCKKGLGELEK